MTSRTRKLIALAGQPNCGKSTIFNMLTGARQHVANFPGVTVEKKQGTLKIAGDKYDLVDLPGTYSLTSYTQEERVARDFLLFEKPDCVVAVIDSSNIERHLYFVLQLLEMQVKVVLCLNMSDVAERRGIIIDSEALATTLGVEVITTNGKSGKGANDLKSAIASVSNDDVCTHPQTIVDYSDILTPEISRLKVRLEKVVKLTEILPSHWLAVKLLENDSEAKRITEVYGESDGIQILNETESVRNRLIANKNKPEKIVAASRYNTSGSIIEQCVKHQKDNSATTTDIIDSVVLNRFLGPLILISVLFLFYQVAMKFGTQASDVVYPYIGAIKTFAGELFVSNDPIRTGLLKSLVVDGIVGGIVAILYYVPMFFILFALLAMLEDSGYMARVAFLLDRLLRWFGLHGQSTLPLILGGVVTGGCCVPGVLATRAMKDEKSRIVTILIMPLMNCLAKLPFYALIVALIVAPTAGIYIGDFQLISYQGLILYGLSVFSFCIALFVAKLFSTTIVKGEKAPFVMELPAYHLPTVRGVLNRAIERVWLFVKKIVTIVAVVQVGVWFFVTFPGIGMQREMQYDQQQDNAKQQMISKAGGGSNPYSVILKQASVNSISMLTTRIKDIKAPLKYIEGKISTIEQRIEELKELPNSGAGKDQFVKEMSNLVEAKERASQAVQKRLIKLQQQTPALFLIANQGVSAQGEKNKKAAKAALAFKKYERELKSLARDRKQEQLRDSFAGRVGRGLEPISKYAGFEWRMNIALVASFAAKESLVGTLGTIYSVEESDNANKEALTQSVAKTESKWTIWHKLAILIFVAMFPPCMATMIVIRNETNSWKWAGFSFAYPIVLGFILAVAIFQFGRFI